MLGRQVTAALRRPLQARLRTVAAPQTQYTLAIRTFSHAPRLLDPVGRPRKAVGEPSRPVKRAVKKAAKKPATPEDDAAAAKVAEKKALAAEKKRLAKEREKQKTAAAAKKAKEAALSPEQIEKKKAALVKAEVRELRKIALDPPFPTGKFTAYGMFMKEKGKDLSARLKSESGLNQDGVKSALAEHAKNVQAAFNELPASDLEHYNHLAHTYKDAKIAEYKRWVESHSLEEIRLANNARHALRRRGIVSARHKQIRVIQDERQPMRVTTPYILFSISRHASGDFKNIALGERSKLIAQEWKALSEDETTKYNNLWKQDKERYASEIESVSGSDA